jgi:TonB family protein
MVTIFIQPAIRDGVPPAGPDLSRMTVPLREPRQALQIEVPPIDFEVGRNPAAVFVAPSPKGSDVDMAPYLRQAELPPGRGVTVVLRVEVLETGEPGRVVLDISSGIRLADQAAIEYARTRRWYAGRANGVPHTMWIRWGVRLQG